MIRLSKLIYSNKIFAALILLVQLAIFAAAIIWLSEYSGYIYAAAIVLSAILILYEIQRDEEPGFKITWIMLMAIIPIFGVLLYLYLHFNFVSRRIRRAAERVKNDTSGYLVQDKDAENEFMRDLPESAGVAKYLYNMCGYPIYSGGRVKYFPLGDDMFPEFKRRLERAEKFIFLEFFIINKNGKMWPEVLEILKRKAAQGVEVRVMYDGMGCMTTLPSGYPERLNKFGIDCRIFSPITPFFSTYQNNRDHRKIAVIDGHTAFTGGVNLADEYINVISRFGHWKDNAIMVNGEAVKPFTAMFLEMWNIARPEIKQTDYSYYLNGSYGGGLSGGGENIDGGGYIIPFSDSPLSKHRVGERMYIDILNTAKKYVHIMTPYLVVSYEMLEALKFAARRGVDVKIILPHIPDKPYAFWLAGTYYTELINAGVKIYEYLPGFVHSKMSVSDDFKAVIGTINHDYRSLYLHYECAAYLLKSPSIKDMEKDFQETLEKCLEITVEIYKKRSGIKKIAGLAIRTISPLL